MTMERRKIIISILLLFFAVYSKTCSKKSEDNFLKKEGVKLKVESTVFSKLNFFGRREKKLFLKKSKKYLKVLFVRNFFLIKSSKNLNAKALRDKSSKSFETKMKRL